MDGSVPYIELTAARGMLDEEHGLPRKAPLLADQNTYTLGLIGKTKVVIANRKGVAGAARVGSSMVFTFPNIRVGLLVGIAAGIPDLPNNRDIRLGDVIISDDPLTGGVAVHDTGTRLPNGSILSDHVSKPPLAALRNALASMRAEHSKRDNNNITANINQMLQKYPRLQTRGYCPPGSGFDRLLQADYQHKQGNSSCATCDPAREVRRQKRSDKMHVVHYGSIASGNQVIKYAPKREALRVAHGAIGLEMEAKGLVNFFPLIVIRGISDYADTHKNDRWQPCAASAAAACAKEFLDHLQTMASHGEPTAEELLYGVYRR